MKNRNGSRTRIYCFVYVPPRPYKYLKFQYIKILAGPGAKLAPKYVLKGNSKYKVSKKTPSYPLIMDNFQTSLAITVDKNRRNPSRVIVDRLI